MSRPPEPRRSPATRFLMWVWVVLLLIAAAGWFLWRESPVQSPPGARPGSERQVWREWRSVLFRVSPPPTDDLPAPTASFVLGTLHFGNPDELGLDLSGLRARMAQSRVLVNEVDGDAPWDPAMDHYRVLDDAAGLPGLIGQASFTALQHLLPRIDEAWLTRLKPWVALALLEARGETVSEQTLDRRVEIWAADLRLPVVHLETLQEQLAALDCVPPQEHALVLQERLRSPQLFESQPAQVLTYYRTRNLAAWLDEIDAMDGLSADARAIEGRARGCLIEARNERWLGKLDDLLRQGGVFVAVGAIHLTGQAGLLERLRQRGFEIVAESVEVPGRV